MELLNGKNILILIPKDYYDEEEFEVSYDIFKREGANVIIASEKMKEAVGMKSGRRMPDRLIVDCMEGITGDSYVTGGTGTRQIKAVFQGAVVIGGSGASKYLWKEETSFYAILLTLLFILDRTLENFPAIDPRINRKKGKEGINCDPVLLETF